MDMGVDGAGEHIATVGIDRARTGQVSADGRDLLTIDGKRAAKGALGHLDGARALMLRGGTAAGDTSAAEVDEDGLEEASDYSNLNLPDLELPNAPDVILPGSEDSLPDLPDIPDLPDLPDLSEGGVDGLPELPDLPDLPDLSDADGSEDGLPELSDLPDLPEIKIA